MFQRASAGKNLIALLLPLTFIWSWAACSVLCDEIAAHLEKQTISSTGPDDESRLGKTDTESCPFTANVTIIETRQTIISHLSTTANTVSFLPYQFLSAANSIYPADLNQNSPLRVSSRFPLFLKHRSLRI